MGIEESTMDTKARIGLGIGAVVLAGMVGYLLKPGPKATETASTGTETTDTQKTGEVAITPPTTQPISGTATTQPVAVVDPFAGPTTKPTVSSTPTEPGDTWATALNTGEVHTTGISRTGTEMSTGTTATHTGAVSPSSKTWKIASGETLYSISVKAYGSTRYVSKILAANPGMNPSRLKIGQTINLPDISSETTARSTGSSAESTATSSGITGKTYKVSSGDSLRKIALKVYGKESMWQKIYDLNKSTIGSDPAKLKAGMTLQLPEGGSSH